MTGAIEKDPIKRAIKWVETDYDARHTLSYGSQRDAMPDLRALVAEYKRLSVTQPDRVSVSIQPVLGEFIWDVCTRAFEKICEGHKCVTFEVNGVLMTMEALEEAMREER